MGACVSCNFVSSFIVGHNHSPLGLFPLRNYSPNMRSIRGSYLSPRIRFGLLCLGAPPSQPSSSASSWGPISRKNEAKWPEIQKKFKDLVKKYHPDKNQGNNKFENKLKKVTLAYSQLKKSMDRKQR